MSKIISDMTNEEYHGDRTAISKSGLDMIDKSPAHFKWAQENPRTETDSMAKGSLIHTLVLEPEKFNSEYIITPENAPKRPTPAQINAKKPSDSTIEAIQFWDNFNAMAKGKKVLSAKDLEDAQRIVEAVTANPDAMDIIESAKAFEESVFAEDFESGVMCKCRADIRVDGGLFDLKTTRNASAKSFSYSVRSFRYHVQAAFYMDLYNIAGMDIRDFGFIAVDTVDMPYQCTVFRKLSDEAVILGRKEYQENLRVYAKCLENNDWPGYPQSYDVLDLAGYGYDLDEIEEG